MAVLTHQDILDPFFRKLFPILMAEVQSRREKLSSGVASDYPEYREHVGYIAALIDILNKCRELEVDHYGGTRGEID